MAPPKPRTSCAVRPALRESTTAAMRSGRYRTALVGRLAGEGAEVAFGEHEVPVLGDIVTHASAGGDRGGRGAGMREEPVRTKSGAGVGRPRVTKLSTSGDRAPVAAPAAVYCCRPRSSSSSASNSLEQLVALAGLLRPACGVPLRRAVAAAPGAASSSCTSSASCTPGALLLTARQPPRSGRRAAGEEPHLLLHLQQAVLHVAARRSPPPAP
jgi:hypothetical protein